MFRKIKLKKNGSGMSSNENLDSTDKKILIISFVFTINENII
jgi:hypothetical protein